MELTWYPLATSHYQFCQKINFSCQVAECFHFSDENCFVYLNAVYRSEPDQEDRAEIESGSSEDDDDESSDDRQPSASGVTSSGESGIAASSSSSEVSSRSM